MLLEMPLPKKPSSVLILGAGQFGSLSAAGIADKWPDCSIHIADLKTQIDPSLPGEHHQATEAMDILIEMIDQSKPDQLVVPCIPVHVAFNWVLSHLGFCIPVPIKLMEILPGAVAGNDGCIYSSLSDFTCPADCGEPRGYCPVTEKERKTPLFEIMSSMNVPTFTTLTVRSLQLLPGTGALTSGVLFELLDRVRRKRGRFLIATASRCHGVMHGFTH